MGVPKFFWYNSERYPCLTQKIKNYQVADYDNLYLDANGIIHNCSHPNDEDANFPITEEEIFKNIFHYIEVLFSIIKPQRLFFMAMDGVAPRAKINQQRGRRFRTAKDAEILLAKAKAMAQPVPTTERFDSNCITPGTLFMSKLSQQLKYFITYKISTDKLWRRCKVILSGSEVPGEGEHKIMDYIRYLKAQDDYDVNTRHCLYGLDADLIMLGMCTHERCITLLREEVKYAKEDKKIKTPEEIDFCLLHLSLLREYIEHEFSTVKDKISFEFDLEKIIDDWILIGFLVGNDFIPHLPSIHIFKDALPTLYNIYKEILPTLDGYINESGTLNLERFEKFFNELSKFDLQHFDDVYTDLKYFEMKTGKRPDILQKTNSSDSNLSPKTTKKDLMALIKSTNESLLGASDEEDADDFEEDLEVEFIQHKRNYYVDKMGFENVDEEVLRSQAEGYVRAIQWILNYYYYGCCSWSWFYPHHYAPFISDIKDFKDMKIEFDLGKPFLPFEQLLGCLPVASKALLPEVYHNLMTDEQSPIFDYYPTDFQTDLNEKIHDWEAIVLIPFIDAETLQNAMKPYNGQLLPEEAARNIHGLMSIFTYTKENMGIYDAPEYFPSITSHVNVEQVLHESILLPREKVKKGLLPEVDLDTYVLGFPTFRHVPHTSRLTEAKVKVFESTSRGKSIILDILPKPAIAIEELAKELLGEIVYVNWPYLIEAQVVALANSDKKLTLASQTSGVKSKESVKTEIITNSLKNNLVEEYKTRKAVNLGEIEIIVFARPIIGTKFTYGAEGKMELEKQWDEITGSFPYQLVLKNIKVHKNEGIQVTSITDIFTPKSRCFMLGHPHYGAMGEVTEGGADLKSGRIKVAMGISSEPNLDLEKAMKLQESNQVQYMRGHVAAQYLGISPYLVSRITGTILVTKDFADLENSPKFNIGLNLKFNKKNMEVPGYTRRDSNGGWLYSTKTVEIIRNYVKKCPQLFENIEKCINDNILSMNIFSMKDNEEVNEVLAMLKEMLSPVKAVARAVCGSEMLEPIVIQEIEKDIDKFLETQNQTSKTLMMQVKPYLLFKPGLNVGTFMPDPKAVHNFFDRIICIRESFTVPCGSKGVIIGIQKGEKPFDCVYEVLFDKAFPGGITLYECSPNRCYRLGVMDFINISHGQRLEKPQKSWRDSNDRNQPTQTPTWTPPNTHRGTNNSPSKFQSWRQSPVAKGPNKQNEPTNLFRTQTEPPHFGRMPNKPAFNQRHPDQKMNHNEQKNYSPIIDAPKFPNPNPNVYPPQHGQSGSEFSTLWNALRKQNKSFDSTKPVGSVMATASPEPPSLAKLKINPPSNTNKVPDPSAFLKAMLKIPDGKEKIGTTKLLPVAPPNVRPAAPTNKPFVFPQAPKTADAPPLVQQMFDHARQSEMKGKDPIWYTSQLLSYYQMNCAGFPRYMYVEGKNNMVVAQIILPDLRLFSGELCPSHALAAESVAKKVYEELQLHKVLQPSAMGVLGPPPSHWFKARPNDNIPPPPAHGQLPRPPVFTPAQMPMPKWNPGNNPHNMKFPPMGPHRSEPPQRFVKDQFQPHGQIRYETPMVRRDRQNESVKKSTSFVPLQAEKKNRNAGLPSSTKDSGRKGGPDKKEERKPVKNETKEEKRTTANPQNIPQNPPQQRNDVNKRRSRVAANFGTAPMSNGGDRQ